MVAFVVVFVPFLFGQFITEADSQWLRWFRKKVPPVNCVSAAIRCVPSEYATIQLCANAAVAGDTCLVSAGTYDERVTSVNSGTAGNLITYRAVADCVSNNGTTRTAPCVKVRGWTVTSDNYLTIQGFEITNEGMTGDGIRPVWVTGADHVSVLNNYIHDTDVGYPCIVAGTSTNTVFRGNNIQRCAVTMDVFATVLGPFNIQAGVNDTISLSVQGGAAQVVTLTAGAARTVTQIGAEVDAQTTGISSCAVFECSTQLSLSSDTIGPTSSLEVLTVPNNAYATLGMALGVGVMGGHQAGIAGSGTMTDWLVEQNVIAYVSDGFTPGTGDRGVFRNNTFGPNDRYDGDHIDFVQSGAFTKMLLEGNLSTDNNNHDNHFVLSQAPGTEQWIIRFNDMCRTRGGSSVSGGANYHYFYNNTAYDNYTYFFGINSSPMHMLDGATNNLARNNLWYKSTGPTDAVYVFSGSGAIDRDYDLWWLVGDPAQTNDVNGDPLVTNGATCDFTLQSGSPAIDTGGPLTTVAAADTGSGTSLVVTDAKPFQDGWAGVTPDAIAVGTVGNVAQITVINYTTNTITLAASVSRSDSDPVWLYGNSRGTRVLYGTAPDIGAHERVP